MHATGEIPPAIWDEIWTLTQEFYDVERDYAEAELRRRQSIAMFRMNGALLGMAAIDIQVTEFRGRRLAAISTAHVLIRENWRGRNLIQKLGMRMFLRARLRHPLRPIYWFFDTFSYKSYLLLPRNFRTYWPRHDQPTPEPRAALIDQLATQAYGPAWRPARGLAVRSGQKRLRETAAPLVLRRRCRSGSAVLRAHESRPRRGRHAGLPVPADVVQLAERGSQGAAAARTPRRTLTAEAARATLHSCSKSAKMTSRC